MKYNVHTYSARNASSFQEIWKNHNIGLKYKNDGEAFIPTNHRYYYEIQGQLAITGRNWCDLYFWCPNETKIVKIYKDNSFWVKILPRLKAFFMECVLPELVDPRASRNLPLREPHIRNLIRKNS